MECRAAHLVLVGTSILRNTAAMISRCASGDQGACQTLGISCDEASRVKERAEACSRARPGSREDKECRDLYARGETAWKAATSYLALYPQEASAEANAMTRVIEGGCRGVGTVKLYASDSDAGRVAAEILEDYLRQRCPQTRVAREDVPSLGREMWEGLANLASLVLNDIKSLASEGYSVALNLTGGFKPEAAYALLAAWGRAHIAYYKHEAFRDEEVVVLPIIDCREAEVLARAEKGGVIVFDEALKMGFERWRLEGIACALHTVNPSLYKLTREGLEVPQDAFKTLQHVSQACH